MAVLTGHTELITELEQYAKALDRETLEDIVASGGQILVEGVRGQIRPSRTGTLESSITAEPLREFGFGDAVGVDIGWAKIKRPRGSRSSHSHVYGPILEYSEKRQLRHMLEGFELSHVEAVGTMLKLVFKKLKV
ncbi:MAG: HK97 gp10 family phage protein [Clostridia bacterium]|nr:HK97 gp10 family phage protein [Clostridia bacterium]